MNKCRSCSAKIVWMITSEGKRIPVDWCDDLKNDMVFDHKQHTSHFATCPNAKSHRRARK